MVKTSPGISTRFAHHKRVTDLNINPQEVSRARCSQISDAPVFAVTFGKLGWVRLGQARDRDGCDELWGRAGGAGRDRDGCDW